MRLSAIRSSNLEPRNMWREVFSQDFGGEEMDDELNFTRSSYCGGESCCLEVALAPQSGLVYVRNSQKPAAQVAFSTEEWRAFLAGAKNNEFDA